MKTQFLIHLIALLFPITFYAQTKTNLVNDSIWLRTKYGAWGGPGVNSKPGPMDKILLKDYAPRSSLIEKKTFVEKARFPAIDVHTHVVATTPKEVTEWVKTMDDVGIQTSIILTNATGHEFDKLVDLYLKPYPSRFILFCGMVSERIDAADYQERVLAELQRCYNKGARGVGEWTDKGLGFTNDSMLDPAKRLHADDKRLDAFWDKCAELNMPVSFHIADHPSSWQPLDVYQERTPDFQHFNQFGKAGLSYEQLLKTRDNLLERHPNTIFLACHLANEGNDLDRLAKLLDRFPNLYLDIAARDYELGRAPRSALNFLTKYSDRILFGTDMGRKKSMYQAWWRLLESKDEFMTGRVWWRYYGLGLPSHILRRLYSRNAKKILKQKN